ncbi:MAG: hypothetical protein OEW04_01900 [Nitrospirota bacterium]|nr:hypothetical protein [Nitrospirota bacterium]
MQRRSVVIILSFLFAFFSPAAQAGIYDFKGGVRIPAGSCATYSNTPRAEFVSSSGGLSVYNMDGRIDVSCVCQLPVPEKARIRQFVMVGNVSKGRISAQLGGVSWNVPRQHSQYASVSMEPATPYEVPQMKQKKVVQNLPVSGNKSLRTDRIQTYFIEARLTSGAAVNIEDALEIFYFEVYWDY